MRRDIGWRWRCHADQDGRALPWRRLDLNVRADEGGALLHA
jgi:hypothetical protein